MRRIRFLNKQLNGRWGWSALVYFRPEPRRFPCVDFEDFRMESAYDFATEAEARADEESVEKKLGLRVSVEFVQH